MKWHGTPEWNSLSPSQKDMLSSVIDNDGPLTVRRPSAQQKRDISRLSELKTITYTMGPGYAVLDEPLGPDYKPLPVPGRLAEHPASKDYGNDARDAIQAQPAIQQMLDDYDEFIAQLEAQIDDLKIERAQLKAAAATGGSYETLVSLLRNGVMAAMPNQYPDPWQMPHAEALALIARLIRAVDTRALQLRTAPSQADIDNDTIEAARPEPEGNPVDVYGPDDRGRPLFSGHLTGAGRYALWSRVIPSDGYIDLPPAYQVARRRS